MRLLAYQDTLKNKSNSKKKYIFFVFGEKEFYNSGQSIYVCFVFVYWANQQ